jgi:putative ABC transport system permease protein
VTGWAAALRVARREARRAKGRSALVVAMIMLPVATLGFAAAIQDSFELTPAERAERLMGSAQARVSWPSEEPVHQHPTEPDLVAVAGPPRPRKPTASRPPRRAWTGCSRCCLPAPGRSPTSGPP